MKITLNDAIQHINELLEKDDVCEECKVEHKQLLMWLEELKAVRMYCLGTAVAIASFESQRAIEEKDGAKSRAEEILETLLIHGDPSVRIALAEQDYGLDVLVDDPCDEVRAAVARQGKHLDTLVHDKSEYVRATIAEQAEMLDVLVSDECAFIREKVAEKGYGLRKLVYDSDPYVRIKVARQGYGLDKLVDDVSPFVRIEVAKQGFCLGKLMDDCNKYVRKEVAEQGYGLATLAEDKDPVVREIAKRKLAEQAECKKFINNIKIADVARKMATLAEDEDPAVRTVAKRKLAEQIKESDSSYADYAASHGCKCGRWMNNAKIADLARKMATHCEPRKEEY